MSKSPFPKTIRVVLNGEIGEDDSFLMVVESEKEWENDGQAIATYYLASIGKVKITKEIIE